MKQNIDEKIDIIYNIYKCDKFDFVGVIHTLLEVSMIDGDSLLRVFNHKYTNPFTVYDEIDKELLRENITTTTMIIELEFFVNPYKNISFNMFNRINGDDITIEILKKDYDIDASMKDKDSILIRKWLVHCSINDIMSIISRKRESIRMFLDSKTSAYGPILETDNKLRIMFVVEKYLKLRWLELNGINIVRS